jgi:hypothetical protein
VACADFQFGLTFYNWSGAVTGNASQSENGNDIQTGLSPTGRLFFSGGETSQAECGLNPPSTCVDSVNGVDQPRRVPAQSLACMFIDDAHLLTPQGVIDLLSRTQGASLVAAAPLLNVPASGQCAGRFPGV